MAEERSFNLPYPLNNDESCYIKMSSLYFVLMSRKKKDGVRGPIRAGKWDYARSRALSAPVLVLYLRSPFELRRRQSTEGPYFLRYLMDDILDVAFTNNIQTGCRLLSGHRYFPLCQLYVYISIFLSLGVLVPRLPVPLTDQDFH